MLRSIFPRAARAVSFLFIAILSACGGGSGQASENANDDGPLPEPAPTGNVSTVQNMRGLVAFWTFAEPGGRPRRAARNTAASDLIETNGIVRRHPYGPYSGRSAKFDGDTFLRVPYESLGSLLISGSNAQVTVFVVLKVFDPLRAKSVAGIWSEASGINDDRGTRMYALLMDMPAYGGGHRITPHVSSEGGVTRRADGSPLPWCVDYAITAETFPTGQWFTAAFTYDGNWITAYYNGKATAPTDGETLAKRQDRYFRNEGPGGGTRGINPYYHGRGIHPYGPFSHVSLGLPPPYFSVGGRFANGSTRSEPFVGLIGGVAVFNRALSNDEVIQLHESAGIGALNRQDTSSSPAASAAPSGERDTLGWLP